VLNSDEFRLFLGSLKLQLSPEDIQQFHDFADVNKDGNIVSAIVAEITPKVKTVPLPLLYVAIKLVMHNMGNYSDNRPISVFSN